MEHFIYESACVCECFRCLVWLPPPALVGWTCHLEHLALVVMLCIVCASLLIMSTHLARSLKLESDEDIEAFNLASLCQLVCWVNHNL